MTHRQLRCRIASVPRQHRSWSQEHITILAIRWFAWNCMLSVWNRRHDDSHRAVQKTVDTRVARETPTFSSSRTGTIRTSLDSTTDGILSSPKSGMTASGFKALACRGHFFRLIIASQAFELRLKVESDDIEASSSNRETEVRIARISSAPSRGLHCSRFSPRKLHTVLWQCKSLMHNKREILDPALLAQCLGYSRGADDDLSGIGIAGTATAL